MSSMIETMHDIDSAMAGAPGYAMLTMAASKSMLKKGFVEINEAITNDDSQFATRLTASGMAFLNSNSEPVNVTVPAEKVKTMTTFTILSDIPKPESKRNRLAGRTSKYDFASLEVGQMFFVPATEAQPNPAKSLGSIVTNTNRKYATVTDELKPGRKGKDSAERMVPVLVFNRYFSVRPYTLDGVAGAGVWRDK